MRRLMTVLLYAALTILARQAFAVGPNEVAYLDGTLPGIAQGSIGRFDTTVPDQLQFRFKTAEGGSGFAPIPYAEMREVRAEVSLARHLGFAPALAVGLVRHRERRHFLILTFRDARGVVEIARFEVAKTDALPLLAILKVRAPEACARAGECVREVNVD